MPEPEITKYKIGQEISFDGGTWGRIEVINGGTIWVTDEDGGDHELTDARIDTTLPSAPINACSPAWEYSKSNPWNNGC